MAAVGMLKFIVCFVETTHEPLHLDKLNFGTVRDMDIPTNFVQCHIFVNYLTFDVIEWNIKI
jgi:hypothetical protein